jgi:hypothetical protein
MAMLIGPLQEAILATLSDGAWHLCSSIGRPIGADKKDVWLAIRRLRRRGLLIEGDTAGVSSRGVRLRAFPGRSWLPTSRIPDFWRMTKAQGFSEAEAQRMILDDIEVERRRSKAA